MSRQSHIAIIGNGFVGSAYTSYLKSRATLTVWDKLDGNDYPYNDIKCCDLVIICVGTPELPSGQCDLTSVHEAVASTPPGPPILIRSTVPPGTTLRLAEEFNRDIAFSPEYIGETGDRHLWGNKVGLIPHLIIGGKTEVRKSILKILQPLIQPSTEFLECTSLEAEIIKYMENAFLATKVAYVNELYDYCSTLGADWQTVRRGWLMDPRIGESHSQVYMDERGFGGSCLPKDLNSLIYEMSQHGVNSALLQGVRESNRRIRNARR